MIAKKVNISIGENPKDPVFTITDLLPHLGKDQGSKNLRDGISGEGLNILVGSELDKSHSAKEFFLKLLNKEYGIDEHDFISAEIEVVPAGPARDLGLDRSVILAYGHDDRVSAYTALRAILDLRATPKHTAICIMCDKEEVGSQGATGMAGHLFENSMAEKPAETETAFTRMGRPVSPIAASAIRSLFTPRFSSSLA